MLKPPIEAVSVAANAAVEAKQSEHVRSSSTRPRTSLSDKPLAKNLEHKCDNPYHHVDTTAEACRYVHTRCPQSSGIFNYQALPYCMMGGFPTIAVTLLILWLVALRCVDTRMRICRSLSLSLSLSLYIYIYIYIYICIYTERERERERDVFVCAWCESGLFSPLQAHARALCAHMHVCKSTLQ